MDTDVETDVAMESAALADAGSTNAEPDASSTIVEPAVGFGPEAVITDPAESADTDPTTGSGSDHGSSPVDQGAAAAVDQSSTATDGEGAAIGGTDDETRSEAGQGSVEAGSTSALTDRSAGSESSGEQPDDPDGSASARVADAEKGVWRPSDLGDAERPAPDAEAKTSPSPTNEATAEDALAVLDASNTDAATGGTTEAGPHTSSDPATFVSNTEDEALAASSTTEGTAGPDDERTTDTDDERTTGTDEDQTDASAEVAGTRRS
jgi:hypothetical protein